MYYITFCIYFINFNHFTVCLPKINKMVDNSDFGCIIRVDLKVTNKDYSYLLYFLLYSY